MMNRLFSALAIAGLTPILLSQSVLAQSRSLPPQLTPDRIQQFSRDLIRSNSEDFFRQGSRQLEREVDILLKRRMLLSEGVLTIDEKLQIQQQLSDLEKNQFPPGEVGK